MTLDELGKDERAAILAIAARHGVQRVRVFVPLHGATQARITTSIY